jgi:hypothetical protein
VAIARRSGGVSGVVLSARVECPGATRGEAQTRIADAAIEALLTLLREKA